MVGNPNVGKSVVFNYLTKKYVAVSNYPGTTVEVSRGKWQGHEVVDTPGVYGLSAASDEERLAQQVIDGANIIVNVVDATRLRRDLFLTLQLQERKLPMMVVVNMMDEAEKAGTLPDLESLAAQLGVPVLGAAAVLGAGMPALAEELSRLCQGPSRVAVKKRQSMDVTRAQANRIYATVMSCQAGEQQLTVLDRWLTSPWTGAITGALVLMLIGWLIGGLVANTVVDFTEGVVMNRWLIPPLLRVINLAIPHGLLHKVVLGDFGLLVMVLGYGVGLLLPLVLSFYLLLALLEDSGYMPRLAVLLDNLFRPLGLNGKGVIPLILGFGCVTMALISTRLLSTRRERIILSILLSLAVPCSAQTGIIALMLVPMGIEWVALYVLVLLGVFLGAGIILNKVITGHSSGLFLELPRMRLPRLGNVLRKSWAKTRAFLQDALPLFALGSVLVTLLDHFHALTALEHYMAPLTVGWLKLPPQVVGAFIMGIIRRDFGAAGLLNLGLTNPQLFVALLTMTLFVPCIASILVAIKEQGLIFGLGMWLGSLVLAVLLGGLVACLLV